MTLTEGVHGFTTLWIEDYAHNSSFRECLLSWIKIIFKIPLAVVTHFTSAVAPLALQKIVITTVLIFYEIDSLFIKTIFASVSKCQVGTIWHFKSLSDDLGTK